MKILELLYNQENRFVEEIDRIEKNPDEFSFIEADSESGLICLHAQENSFDWNIVRQIGNWQSVNKIIGLVPFPESVLLTNEEITIDNLACCTANGSLIYFENNNFNNSFESDYNDNFSLEISLPKNLIKRKASPFNSRIDDLYLVMNNSVCGYCIIIKNSWHYSEIAIEINPEYRNQGFGTALLGLMVEQFNNLNMKLCYVVENDNIASLKIAEKYLYKAFCLNKYILRRN